MGRNKNGDALLAGQLDQQLPEFITRHRIDAGGRLVEDQQLRFMHHGHGQRQALTDAERQFGRGMIGVFIQPETLHQLGDAWAAPGVR